MNHKQSVVKMDTKIFPSKIKSEQDDKMICDDDFVSGKAGWQSRAFMSDSEETQDTMSPVPADVDKSSDSPDKSLWGASNRLSPFKINPFSRHIELSSRDSSSYRKSDNMNGPTTEDHHCRVCLRKVVRNGFDLHERWMPAWAWVGMQPTIGEDLANIAQIKISPNDNLPRKICLVCCDNLKKAVIFVEYARKTDVCLRVNKEANPAEVVKEKWPQPIQVTKNIKSMEIEVKQEVISEDESYGNGPNNYLDTEIKIEPEDVQEQPEMQIRIGNAVSLGALEAKDDNYNLEADTSDLLVEKSLKRIEVPPPVKDEPLSEDESVAELPTECLLCMKSFSSVSGLKAHVIVHHSYKTVKRKISDSTTPEKRTNKHCCQICKRSFVTRTDLMVHETCHNKYSCYKCDAKFDTFALLTNHRKRCKATPAETTHKVKTLDDALRHQAPNSKDSSPVPENLEAINMDVYQQNTDDEAEIITPDYYSTSPKQDQNISAGNSEKGTFSEDYEVCATVYLPTFDIKDTSVRMELDQVSEKSENEKVPTDKIDLPDSGTIESLVNNLSDSTKIIEDTTQENTSFAEEKNKENPIEPDNCSLDQYQNDLSEEKEVISQKDTIVPVDENQKEPTVISQTKASDENNLLTTDHLSNVSDKMSDLIQVPVDESHCEGMHESTNDSMGRLKSVTTQDNPTATNEKVSSETDQNQLSANPRLGESSKDLTVHEEPHDAINMEDMREDTHEKSENEIGDITDKMLLYEDTGDNSKKKLSDINELLSKKCVKDLNKGTNSNISLDHTLHKASVEVDLQSETCQGDLEEAIMEMVSPSDEPQVESLEEASMEVISQEMCKVGSNELKHLLIKSPKDINDSVVKISQE